MGIALAKMEADVTITDQGCILPQQSHNNNTEATLYLINKNLLMNGVKATVKELDWFNTEQLKQFPAYDFVVGTDVVYKMDLVEVKYDFAWYLNKSLL